MSFHLKSVFSQNEIRTSTYDTIQTANIDEGKQGLRAVRI